jgi:hypothetical protein
MEEQRASRWRRLRRMQDDRSRRSLRRYSYSVPDIRDNNALIGRLLERNGEISRTPRRVNGEDKTVGERENAKPPVRVELARRWRGGQRAILVTYLRRIRSRSGEMANRVLSRSRIYTVRLFRATIPKSKLTSRSFPGAFIALAIVLKADPR